MNSVEKWGDNIESAVALALAELKAGRDDVEIEVLEQPSRGFFGIGSKLALVRVTIKEKEKEAADDVTKDVTGKVKQNKTEGLSGRGKNTGYGKGSVREKTPDAVRRPARGDSPSENRHSGRGETAGEGRHTGRVDTKKSHEYYDRGSFPRDDNSETEESSSPGYPSDVEEADDNYADVRNDRRTGYDRRNGSDGGAAYGKGKKKNRPPKSREENDYPETDISDLDFRKKAESLPVVEDHPALKFLRDVTREMGLELDMVCRADDKTVFIDITGGDSRTIIGKRGQTLDAVQYLTSLVVNKNSKEYVRVIIDAEHYRSRRENTLRQLAERQARKVVRTGRTVRLEPMNPYERKVIHATLQKDPRVITRSEGQDPYRRVIIELK